MSHEEENQDDLDAKVKPEEAAVIWSAKKGFRILMPKWAGDKEVPLQVFALIACAMRLTDEESFSAEMYKWYENKKKEKDEGLED
ncbi:MAG: hypothetical protein ACE5DO_13845 [Desulfobacterales bacterium]